MTSKRRVAPGAQGGQRVVDVVGCLPALPWVDRVWVRVEVAHDGLAAGSTHEVGLSERVQALINNGYLEIVAPPPGVVLS